MSSLAVLGDGEPVGAGEGSDGGRVGEASHRELYRKLERMMRSWPSMMRCRSSSMPSRTRQWC